MIIYALTEIAIDEYECSDVLGYFSSMEKAEEAKKSYIEEVIKSDLIAIERMKKFHEEDREKDRPKSVEYWLKAIKESEDHPGYDGSDLRIDEIELDKKL